MPSHFLGLRGASVLATRHWLLTRQAIADVIEAEAMGAIVGPAGLGKTFAIECATETCATRVIRVAFEAAPTMKLVGERLNQKLTGISDSRKTRYSLMDDLLDRLATGRRLIIIGEAQNLNRDCFEYLRHLHDNPDTHFGLLFDGGDGCWEVLQREPMLHSRIYRAVKFARLSNSDITTLMPKYHRIFTGASPALLSEIDAVVGNGRLRSWAAFTRTASALCDTSGEKTVTPEIAEAAMTQLGALL